MPNFRHCVTVRPLDFGNEGGGGVQGARSPEGGGKERVQKLPTVPEKLLKSQFTNLSVRHSP